MTKVCKFCEEEKDLELFEKDKRAPDGHSCRCLICAKEIKRVSALKHRDERLERQRKYREEHPEEYKAMKHEEYIKHRDTYREYGKKYYEDNKEWYLTMCKEYRETHKEQKAATDKAYREKNSDRLRTYANAYMKDRKARDMEFHICVNIRSRIRTAMLGIVTPRERTKALIGCSIDNFRSHLESLFVEGMTWGNYGEWHLDHSRPCASFDLSDAIQQHLCFNYRNTQPMWGSDNLQKSARWNDEDQQAWYGSIYPNIREDLLARGIIDSSYEGC